MQNILAKITQQVKSWQYELFVLVCMTLIGASAYYLGQLSALNKTPITIKEDQVILAAVMGQGSDTSTKTVSKATPRPRTGPVVVSKSSKSKKYHYPWCAGAKQIKEENKVSFESAAIAEAAGYTLAGNCN